MPDPGNPPSESMLVCRNLARGVEIWTLRLTLPVAFREGTHGNEKSGRRENMAGLKEELDRKERAVRDLAERHDLDGIVLTSLASVAWFTGGADLHVSRNTAEAVASIMVTRDRSVVLTNSSEAPRLRAEELVDTGFEVLERPWHEPLSEQVAREAGSMRLGVDNRETAANVPGALYLGPEIAQLRYTLTPEEVDRYREVGRLTGEAIEAAARAVRRGMTEFQVAAMLDHALIERGIEPTVTLVAADERIRRFRHPIPTAKRVEEACMLISCARRYGLIAAATRIVHFGPLPQDLRRRHLATVSVDAAAILASRPGATMGELYERIAAAYAAAGFPGEERFHHQGGAIGYENREYLAAPGSQATVHAPQAFAWNPTIAGTKSEDTYLVIRDDGGLDSATPRLECLTAGDGTWPTVPVEQGSIALRRPDILVL